MSYNEQMATHLTTFEGSITETIREAILKVFEDAEVEVGGGGGHFTIAVKSASFEGKNMLQSQRMVYSAIAHLMAGDNAPLHAVDSLTTSTP